MKILGMVISFSQNIGNLEHNWGIRSGWENNVKRYISALINCFSQKLGLA